MLSSSFEAKMLPTSDNTSQISVVGGLFLAPVFTSGFFLIVVFQSSLELWPLVLNFLPI